MAGPRRLGILTGGGDVPGLNSVIKSVTYRATDLGYEVLGIRRGWEGLTHQDPSLELDPRYVSAHARLHPHHRPDGRDDAAHLPDEPAEVPQGSAPSFITESEAAT